MRLTVHFWAGLAMEVENPGQVLEKLTELLPHACIIQVRHIDEKTEGLGIIRMCPEPEPRKD